MRTVDAPIASNVSAEIVIANSPLGGGVPDPGQFGTGIIAFGKVTMHGTVRTPTFVRLAVEPRAGDTTFTLAEAVSGWNVGDRLVLPDTRHIKETEVTGAGWINAVNQWEERSIQAVSVDGRTLTLNSALQFDHLGARDQNGVASPRTRSTKVRTAWSSSTARMRVTGRGKTAAVRRLGLLATGSTRAESPALDYWSDAL